MIRLVVMCNLNCFLFFILPVIMGGYYFFKDCTVPFKKMKEIKESVILCAFTGESVKNGF